MTTLTLRFDPPASRHAPLRPRVIAQALRSSAANGFGDAVVDLPAERPASPWQRLRTGLGAWWERRQREARMQRDLRLLAQLDTTTLRDLGLERSEIQSLATELHGTAAATRRWTDGAHADHGGARLRINSVDCFL